MKHLSETLNKRGSSRSHLDYAVNLIVLSRLFIFIELCALNRKVVSFFGLASVQSSSCSAIFAAWKTPRLPFWSYAGSFSTVAESQMRRWIAASQQPVRSA